MGQYFLLINLDKQEYVHPHRIDGLAKLWEWCSNPQAGIIPYLLRKSSETGGGDVENPDQLTYAGRWSGNRIVLVGYYDESKRWDTALETYTDISKELKAEYDDFIQIAEI